MITSWNKGAERLFGYTAEEAVGQHITLIVPKDRFDEETRILEQLRQGKRVEHFETVRVRKDGTTRHISLAISPIKNAAGRVVGASKVARDITEPKRAERALRESEEQFRKLADNLESLVHLRTQELEERNTEVLQQSDQLRELSNRLLQIQDDERRRIARELHDSAGQIVAALAMNVATITQHAEKSPALCRAAQDTSELIQQLTKEIRTMSYLLHPPLLDESGLCDAVRWYVRGLVDRSGLDIDVDISENLGRVSRDLELALFRIVQECLTNIHRHSGSKTAAICIWRDAGNMHLEIQDHGTGISTDQLAAIRSHRSGVGIAGMRERVRHFGGVLKIVSNGTGTKISVTVPTHLALEREAALERSSAAG